MSERSSDLSDEGLSRKLAAELPRYPAPPALRARLHGALAPPSRPGAWLPPALAAATTALGLVLFFLPMLPRITPADPVQRLTRSVVAEHTRALLWGARVRPDVIPAALPWLSQESGIEFQKVFMGDDRLTLLAAEPVYLEQQRGLAVHYRDPDGHHVSYVVLPAPGLSLPERRRVSIDRFRPALLHEGGFSVLLWRQGELACFMVSDMVSETDLTQFKDYFLRVRRATEPKPAY